MAERMREFPECLSGPKGALVLGAEVAHLEEELRRAHAVVDAALEWLRWDESILWRSSPDPVVEVALRAAARAYRDRT